MVDILPAATDIATGQVTTEPSAVPWDDAIDVLGQMIQELEALPVKDPLQRVEARSALGFAHLNAGDTKLALRLLNEARTDAAGLPGGERLSRSVGQNLHDYESDS